MVNLKKLVRPPHWPLFEAKSVKYPANNSEQKDEIEKSEKVDFLDLV